MLDRNHILVGSKEGSSLSIFDLRGLEDIQKNSMIKISLTLVNTLGQITVRLKSMFLQETTTDQFSIGMLILSSESAN
jgi:hypothetical protein